MWRYHIFTCEDIVSFLSICYHSLYHWLLYNKKRFNAPTTTQGNSLVVAVRHNKWVITLRGWHIWIQNKFNLIQMIQPSSWFTCIYWTTGQSFSLECNTTKPLLQRFRKPVVKMLSAFVGLVFVLFASLILDARGKVVFIHWMKISFFYCFMIVSLCIVFCERWISYILMPFSSYNHLEYFIPHFYKSSCILSLTCGHRLEKLTLFQDLWKIW